MAEAKVGKKKVASLTNQLVKKWALSDSPKSGLLFDKSKIEAELLTKVTKKFLDFNENELSSIVKEFLVKGKYVEGARDEQQLNFAIFSKSKLFVTFLLKTIMNSF